MAENRSSPEYRAKDAARAREARRKQRIENPGKTCRTFICEMCGKSWETEAKGRFRFCSECKEKQELLNKSKDLDSRTKTCPYCKTVFVDETKRKVQYYCTEECRRRDKVIRAGLLPEKGFLADRVLDCSNVNCSSTFTPLRDNQVFCSDVCRLATYEQDVDYRRYKRYKDTGEAFYDTSLRNNTQFAHKVEPIEPVASPRLVERRRERTGTGAGGRLDDISTLSKLSATWKGRVSELVYLTYRPEASDMVATTGAKAQYDIRDPSYGRINVKGAAPSSRFHTPIWVVKTAGLRYTCDYVFMLGYSADWRHILHMWLVPSNVVSDRFCPSDTELSKYEVSSNWGLDLANNTLAQFHALPEPIRIDPKVWLDNPDLHRNPTSTTCSGRRGELLYQGSYPDSKDMNRFEFNYPYDFEDPDGVRVNVKLSGLVYADSKSRWVFGRDAESSHMCDVYHCIGLDRNDQVVAEYRIPAEIWGDRGTVHIYPNGKVWEPYKVQR